MNFKEKCRYVKDHFTNHDLFEYTRGIWEWRKSGKSYETHSRKGGITHENKRGFAFYPEYNGGAGRWFDFTSGYSTTSPLDFFCYGVLGVEEEEPSRKTLERAVEEIKKIARLDFGSEVTGAKENNKNTRKYAKNLLKREHGYALEYVNKRGISRNTAEYQELGFSGGENNDYTSFRVAFPFVDDNGDTHTIAFGIVPTLDYTTIPYSLPDKYVYLSGEKGGVKDIPYGIPSLEKDGPIVICEGMFDALTSIQEGHPTLCSGGLSWGKTMLDVLLGALKDTKRHPYVILAFDSDLDEATKDNSILPPVGEQKKPGQGAAFKLATKSLLPNGVDFKVCHIPNHKDLNEHYVAEKSLEGVLGSDKLIPQWVYLGMVYLGQKKDFPKFKKHFRKWARGKDESEAAQALDEVVNAGLLQKDVADVLLKEATKVPSEYQIRRELQEASIYVSPDGSVLYEYNGDCWEELCEGKIKKRIQNAWGIHSTAIRTTRTLDSLATASYEEGVQMDSKPLLAFKNRRTLDLETGVVRSSRKEDYCTSTVDYDWLGDEVTPSNYHEKLPAFLKYLDDISLGNEVIKTSIVEFLGYCLYPDNRLEKGLVLYGEHGGNGKSVLAKLLRSMLGKQRVSSISLHQLKDNYMPAELEGRWINISTETKETGLAKGVGQINRNLISGDEIYSRRIFSAPFGFESRVKQIIFTNSPLGGDDAPDATDRRTIYLKLEAEFRDDPVGPNQKVVDRGLSDRLEKERAAILVYIYKEGYLKLRQREKAGMKGREFTYPNGMLSVKDEFREESKPVYAFFKEAFCNDHIRKILSGESIEDYYIMAAEDVFKAYQGWCVHNGKSGNQVTSNKAKFTREFSGYFLEIFPNWFKYKTASATYFYNRDHYEEQPKKSNGGQTAPKKIGHNLFVTNKKPGLRAPRFLPQAHAVSGSEYDLEALDSEQGASEAPRARNEIQFSLSDWDKHTSDEILQSLSDFTGLTSE